MFNHKFSTASNLIIGEPQIMGIFSFALHDATLFMSVSWSKR